jgi:hypothetical protein
MADHSINALKDHAVYEVANILASYLGIERDWICLAEFLSLAAGRMAIPINLEVVSDQCAVELMIADRVCNIVPGKCSPIDTHKSFLAAEHVGFEDKYVLVCRRDYPKLHQDIVSFMAKAPDTSDGAPSVWRIHETMISTRKNAPTLRLIAVSADRNLDQVARSFSSIAGEQVHRRLLNDLIETLCLRTDYRCSFRTEFSGSIAPANMVIVERLLQVFANIRRYQSEFRGASRVTPHDYEAVRNFLVNLPLVPIDRVVSGLSIETATVVYEKVNESSYQLELPDRSKQGHRWFTRRNVADWANMGYTTAKKRLDELEGDGLIESTVKTLDREHGREIFYRFADGRAPPFDWSNPFTALPVLHIE